MHIRTTYSTIIVRFLKIGEIFIIVVFLLFKKQVMTEKFEKTADVSDEAIGICNYVCQNRQHSIEVLNQKIQCPGISQRRERERFFYSKNE